METPDTRTHGADSAVDDEIVEPRNMTAEADANQDIPGAETVPADMPNSPHGEMSLEYSLQNFNALVSANTAMQTEISSLMGMIAIVEEQRDSFKDALAHERGNTPAYLAQIKDLQAADRDNRARLDAKDADLLFARDQVTTLQRRLDRSLGYLDRVLDDEEVHRAPDTRVVPAPKPPVGPALGEIPDAIRRGPEGRVDMDYAFRAQPLHALGETERRRRY